jgi:aldose 1-epimerase
MSPQIVELHDTTAGTRAKILAGYGFNCFSFHTRQGNQEHEVLWSAPGFESGGMKASHSGIPLLFPFPGRIAGDRFQFQGKSYPLEANDGRGNAIHGFVHTRPWRVVEQSPLCVLGEFQASQDDPSLLERWPADFLIRVRYELSANTLRSRIEVQNPDQRPLPFGFGTHPYFRVPLGIAGSAAACRVYVPVAEYWELSNMIATGKRLPAEGPKDLLHGLAFEATQLDDVFTGLHFEAGKCTSTIEDPAAGRRLTMTFGDNFRACVVYNPPHREAICIEPYTCIPDAFRLAEKGIDAGGLVLAPGESARYEIVIEYS